jgi:hypothetical protein
VKLVAVKKPVGGGPIGRAALPGSGAKGGSGEVVDPWK